nr:MAG TPA: hypothetical protein [Caudoviricetes sp.]
MNIQDAIKKLALQGSEMYLCTCTVDNVDENARTVDCTPIDEGAQILGVNLQADQSQEVGVVAFPAVGSDVVVGFISPHVAVVVLTTEITKAVLTVGKTKITVEDNAVSLVTEKAKFDVSADKMKLDIDGTTLEMDGGKSVWNGGSETTANATELQKQLNKCKARIDQIIMAIKTGVPVPQDGGVAYQKSMSGMLTGLSSEDYSGIIDDKIKH